MAPSCWVHCWVQSRISLDQKNETVKVQSDVYLAVFVSVCVAGAPPPLTFSSIMFVLPHYEPLILLFLSLSLSPPLKLSPSLALALSPSPSIPPSFMPQLHNLLLCVSCGSLLIRLFDLQQDAHRRHPVVSSLLLSVTSGTCTSSSFLFLVSFCCLEGGGKVDGLNPGGAKQARSFILIFSIVFKYWLDVQAGSRMWACQ